MKTFFKKYYNILILTFLVSSTSLSAPLEKKEIIIATNNWTSQIVISKILQNILIEQGYKSSLKEVSVKEQWGELARGWIHVQVEVWQGTMEKMFNKFTLEGKIVDAGTHDAITREDWWYPLYVKKLCPGLPHWTALKKCSHIFASGTSNGKGRYLGGPWEKPDKARVRALGLNFVVERAKNGDELWVELIKAQYIKKPIILFNWTPNWVEHKYKGEFVDFPVFDPKCETDPAWGVSKKWKYDCGNPRSGWLKKAVSASLEEKSNCAYRIINNLNFSNSMIAEASYLVDSKGLTTSEAAKVWMKKNQDIWKKWIPTECEDIDRS